MRNKKLLKNVDVTNSEGELIGENVDVISTKKEPSRKLCAKLYAMDKHEELLNFVERFKREKPVNEMELQKKTNYYEEFSYKGQQEEKELLIDKNNSDKSLISMRKKFQFISLKYSNLVRKNKNIMAELFDLTDLLTYKGFIKVEHDELIENEYGEIEVYKAKRKVCRTWSQVFDALGISKTNRKKRSLLKKFLIEHDIIREDIYSEWETEKNINPITGKKTWRKIRVMNSIMVVNPNLLRRHKNVSAKCISVFKDIALEKISNNSKMFLYIEGMIQMEDFEKLIDKLEKRYK